MKYKFLNVLLALTIGVSQAGYLVSFASADSDLVKEYTLPSGQMVYLRENHEQPIVTVDTWVNTGSVNETKENNGVSHFLEHLIFKGTDEYKAGEIDRILEAKGAKFNAATSDDFTHYYITTASSFFEETLKLHASMLRRASIPPEELLQERKVVQEEINRATDNPNHKRFDALSKILYQNHGYGLDTLGPKENIANIPREKILGYYQYWYSPKNFKTVISGDIQPEKALALVQKYFADGAAGKTAQSEKVSDYAPPAVGLPKPLESIQSKVITDNSVSQVYFTLGFPGPSISQRSDIFALDVAMLALGSGSSSRLYQALHEDKPLALSVGAGNMTQKYSGLLYVDASMKAENQEAFKKELAYQLKNLKENGITSEELEKAKTQTIKDFIFQNESSEGVASGIGYNVTIGNLKDYTEYVSNVQKVTLADVKQVLQRYLDFNKAVVIELRPPEKSGKPEARELANQTWVKQIATVNLQQLPNNGTAVKNTQLAVKPSEITKKVLPNGLTLITKPMKSSQTVAFKLFVKGGQGVETIPGLTDMLAPMMMKGTLNRTAEQLSQELESKGMNLSVSAHEDYIEVSGNSVADDFGSLFLVFEDVLNHPLFSPQEIDKERSRLKDTIVANRDNPSSIAMENLSLGLYPHHPYGNVGKRVEAQLDKLDQAALKKYYATYFIPSNMVVSVVGNFDPAVVESYLENTLKASSSPSSASSTLPTATASHQSSLIKTPPVQPLVQNEVIEEKKPIKGATWIAQGWLAPSIESADYMPLKVLNSLLGSGMSSRLFVNLREKRGLAYVVSSAFPSLANTSNFFLFIGTDPSNKDTVIKGFTQEIDQLKNEMVPAKELQEAKDKLKGAFALAHETNVSQAFYLAFYETLGAGYQFDAHYPEKVDLVKAEDVQRVAKKYFLQPNVLSIVSPGVSAVNGSGDAQAAPVKK